MNLTDYIPCTRKELAGGLALLSLALALVGGHRLSRLTNARAIYSEEPVSIYLEENSDLETLGGMLADSGVVHSREELVWAGRLLGWNSFSEGHYQVEGGYSYEVFLSRMSRGIQDPVSVTILPGITRERLVRSLSGQLKFDSLSVQAALADTALLRQLGIGSRGLMGKMLPETYSIYWTSPPESVLRRVVSEFERVVLDEYGARIEEVELNLEEVLTLASIVEWEATREDEKEMISGLYWNRLNRGMRLQADATVNYALGERRRLLYEDYSYEHPYNTYVVDGLPPGPITNPSRSSIEAALYPADHDYLYMVASPDGYHVFSETFEEHRRQSAKWREWLEEQYRIKAQQDSSQEINS
ncbi:MAG: endolytic transglycosylase MltG [Balneolaceae bacterium]|nr:endolytic transglycosylase MltG [Balneolaceae bacterium]